MSCYKEFAHIYDKLIYGDIDYAKWAKVIISICEKYNLSKEDYLDLACGTGNMTKELAKEFKHIWAVDMSQEMLTEAEEKMRKEKIKAKLVCQDISNLKLNKKFDLITCALDSTNYILEVEDLKNYFSSVKEHLKEEGLFIFDINSYYKLTKILGNNIYNYDEDDVVYIWENLLEEDIVDMYITFFIKSGDMYKRFDEEHRERAYTEEFLEKLLNDIGFNVEKKLDSYESEKIKEDAERIVYILKKQ
ncbi:SAM-dependent methyltransferase [Clostridium botulinum]|uniref:SAM-dependent methyltransferase n=1 Tax=Clostridium botulinum C/D str. DC5 TaxID=1443128 RepID=A0A0A0IIZ9_CLOBO|nr:class I SAM-dependent methyltransferase [Clostridium botulinum]KGM94329.1 SAM-dependent methyltransferase [Clostridium botulinum D str. CCUG 7971]KGM99545.1 SAM-dependent methyltransferase [Clostridium botulinum C/D str. DC5]KOC47611.1 SAM-dependent methyltransferase [Clostridium botulinum]KOC52507.1 SAM-dependent methyltransferase [Clostridium botulinum]KOC56495.1 SAM-dependent methyltransferase [Clostridium botulinum]